MTQPRFNPPPGWPVAAGWVPPAGFTSPPDWPPAPEGWQWWTVPAPAAYPPQVVYVPPTVTKQTKDTSHAFHLIMSILTCGVWAVLVWLPMIVWHKIGPRSKSVTRMQ